MGRDLVPIRLSVLDWRPGLRPVTFAVRPVILLSDSGECKSIRRH